MRVKQALVSISRLLIVASIILTAGASFAQNVITWGTSFPTVPSSVTNAVSVATGGTFDLALLSDGTVTSWGSETNVLDGVTNVIAIAADAQTAAALRADGTVMFWKKLPSPDDFLFPTASNIVAISVGTAAPGEQIFALQDNGTIWNYGDCVSLSQTVTNAIAISSYGRSYVFLYADGSFSRFDQGYRPTRGTVPDAVAVAIGDSQTLLLTWNGNVEEVTPYLKKSPTRPGAARAIAAGGSYNLVLNSDGTLTSWITGWGNSPVTNVPASATNVIAIAGGATHALAVIGDGSPKLLGPVAYHPNASAGSTLPLFARAVGFNLSYQWLANGVPIPDATNASPNMLAKLGSDNIAYQVVISNSFGCITSAVVTIPVSPIGFWGNNVCKQPISLADPRQISAGGLHGMVLQGNGSLIGWGENTRKQCNIPSSLTNTPQGNLTIVSIASGAAHNLALRNDGSVAAWGYNGDGQTNVPAAALSNVVAIAAGAAHSLALKDDGSVVAWGTNNDYGQTNVPSTLTNAMAIAAGYYHNLAICSNHTVVAWGMEYSVPESATNVIAVAAGFEHSLALRADGTVVAWGDNTFGQTATPASATNVVAIAAGWLQHGIAGRRHSGSVGSKCIRFDKCPGHSFQRL